MTAELPGGTEMPDDLLAAFWAYEHAVVANDLAVMDESFAPGEQTMRADADGLLVGHHSISEFRKVRGGVSSRSISQLEYRSLSDDVALVISTSSFDSGGQGVQTQIWEKRSGTWQITAAHVSPKPKALDRSIWRIVGDPMEPGVGTGPLAGRSVAVKDLFAISGQQIGAGNPVYLQHAEKHTRTADAVCDLQGAGAHLRGIARTDEFAYSIAGNNAHYGTPPNGAVPGALPGGSSNGPASAVATGQADIGLATDTAGSIRVPASYQGLWGLRTTHDVVSRDGLLPLAQSFDTVGWLTRSGEALQAVADHCLPAGGAEELPWRFAVPHQMMAALTDGTKAAFDELLADLGAGHNVPEIAEVDLGDLGGYAKDFRIVQAAEAWRNNAAWVTDNRSALSPAVAQRFAFAESVTPDQEATARAALARASEHITAAAAHSVLIFPTVPGPAPAITSAPAAIDQTRAATLAMTTPAAIAGLPAISVPLMQVHGALGHAPVGVCLVASAGTDRALVRLARAIEKLTASTKDAR